MGRLWAVAALLALACGCSISADQPTDRVSICKRGRASACQRIADCQGSSGSAAVTFVTTCTQTTQANECTADLLVCPPTETYHLDQDLACASGFSQWDCAAVLAAGDHFPPPPAPCQMICQ